MSKVALADVVERSSGGGTPARDVASFWKGPIPWATVKDFKDGSRHLSNVQESITKLGLNSSSANLIPPGTPIVCMRMGVGRVATASFAVAINQDLRALFVGANFDPDFVVWAIDGIRSQIENDAIGSTVKGIGIDRLLSFEVLDVGLPEQSKIAEVLSTVDRAIAQTEALIAKQQRIKTGLMQDLLTRGIDEHGQLRTEATHRFKDSPLGRIPMEWGAVEFAKVADINRGKFTHRPRDDARFYGGPYPFIQTGDVGANVGRTVDTYSQTLSARGVKVSKEFPKGTIAITIAANIADTAILGRPMYFPDSVVGAIVKEPNCTRFVEMVIRSHKPALEQMAPKSAQSNINLEVLRPLLVVRPDPEEQGRIASIYAASDKQQESDEDSLRKLRSLKTALMQDLLTGKVRVTPLLEPAEAASA